MKIRRYDLNTLEEVGSLCWYKDTLIDFASGIIQYELDGSRTNRQVSYSYCFNRAICSSDGLYAVLYERNGTKGIILKGGSVVREINRSFYHAETYEYPITLFNWIDGRFVIAHCPDSYCKIEIEDIETGECLTRRDSEKIDIFHSRFEVSKDNRYLINTG